MVKIFKNTIKTILSSSLLHPGLVGIFPLLFLLQVNIREIPVRDSLRSFVVICVITILLLIILMGISKDKNKAAIFGTIFLIAFFSYGHLKNFLQGNGDLGNIFSRNRNLVPIFLFVIFFLIAIVYRSEKINKSLTINLNFITILLVSFPVGQILVEKVHENINAFQIQKYQFQEEITLPHEDLPNIYYIVLDGYPRDDILRSTFGYDNSRFLEWLRKREFIIAPCSQSNYSFTRPAMAATFNMTYLGSEQYRNAITLTEDFLDAMVEYSDVQKYFQGLNYNIITFETGYKWLKWNNPDYQFSSNSKAGNHYFAGLNEFELLLLKTTALSILLDRFPYEEIFPQSPRQLQQNRILYTFQKLSEIPKLIQSPFFVYAHITSPHPPYIFGAGGEMLLNDPKDEITGYRNQVDFINTLVSATIDEIIINSTTSPVIIIQGDHGASIDYKALNIDPTQKLAILNTFRLPGISPQQISPSISPVNTFRLVFNLYFSENLEYLDDLSILGKSSPFQQLECDPLRFEKD